MFNELLIIIVSVIISVIISCSIVHYRLKVEVWTGASSQGTSSCIAMVLHMLVLIPYRHCLVHHGELLQMEVVIISCI